MYGRKIPNLKLFPVNSFEGAFCTRRIERDYDVAIEISSQKISRTAVPVKGGFQVTFHGRGESTLVARHSSTRILPNGYHFYHPTKNGHHDDPAVPNGGVLIGNVCAAKLDPFVVDPDIDTTQIACLSQDNTKTVLVGTNLTGDKLYTYSLLNPQHNNNRLSLIVENKHHKDAVGTCIQTFSPESGREISAITAMNDELAVLMSDGSILFGYVQKNKFEYDSLQSASKEWETATLMQTQNHLIAYSYEQEKIRVWNTHFSNMESYKEFRCPKLTALNVSLDGNYLTGVAEEQNDAGFTVYCFELQPFTMHKLLLADTVEDIVISKNGAVMVAMPDAANRRQYQEAMNHDLRVIGTIDEILKNKQHILSTASIYEHPVLMKSEKSSASGIAKLFKPKAHKQDEKAKNEGKYFSVK